MTRSAGNATIHAPYPITVDVNHLSLGDRLALQHILTAMGGVDRIFRRMTLQENTEGPFVYNSHRGREFYPTGNIQEETEDYFGAHPEKRRELLGETTAVRRIGEDFVALPYSELYARESEAIAWELIEASETADDQDLQHFLLRSSCSFITGDYDEADQAWVRVGENLNEATIELTIGFHERDLDDWWGIKRSVQGIVGLVNRKETLKLRAIQQELQSFDVVLGRKYGYVPNSSRVVMVAIDQIECAGWAAHHLIPSAYLLPNNPDFRNIHGGKQVFSWSVLRGRLELMTRPIGLQVLSAQYHGAISEELFKLFVAAHECGHGTGFQFSGTDFGAYALPLEEGRADVVGLCAVLAGAGPGRWIPTLQSYKAVILHLVDGLRQVRANPKGMHAVGSTFQYNWLMKTGALRLGNGMMHFEPGLFLGSYATLCDELYRISSSKDVEKAEKFIRDCGVPQEELVTLAQGFNDLPRDLDPQFEIIGLA